MKVLAIVAAAVAAVVGALIWGGIAIMTDYEIGWAAWGIGVIIGFATVFAGGEGTKMAVLSAILVLLSIFGGKMFAAHHFMQQAFAEITDDALTMDDYNEAKEDARLFAELKSESEWPQFMVDRNFTEALSPADVAGYELSSFRSDSVPLLHEFQATQPTFDVWRRAAMERVRAYANEMSMMSEGIVSIAMQSLGPIDILFALLGIASAFKIVTRAEEAGA